MTSDHRQGKCEIFNHEFNIKVTPQTHKKFLCGIRQSLLPELWHALFERCDKEKMNYLSSPVGIHWQVGDAWNYVKTSIKLILHNAGPQLKTSTTQLCSRFLFAIKYKKMGVIRRSDFHWDRHTHKTYKRHVHTCQISAGILSLSFFRRLIQRHLQDPCSLTGESLESGMTVKLRGHWCFNP